MIDSSLMKFTVKVRSEPSWRRISRNRRPSCNQSLLHQYKIQFSVRYKDEIKLSPIPILIMRNILLLRKFNWLSINWRSNNRYLWLISVLRPTERSSSLSRDNIGFRKWLEGTPTQSSATLFWKRIVDSIWTCLFENENICFHQFLHSIFQCIKAL